MVWNVPVADRAFGHRKRAPRLVVTGAGDVGCRVVEAYRQIESVRQLLADELYEEAKRVVTGAPEPARIWLQADGLKGSAAADDVLLVAKLDSPLVERALLRAARWLHAHGRHTTAVLAVPAAPADTLRPAAFARAVQAVRRCVEATVVTAYRDPVAGVCPREMALPDHRTAEIVLLRVVTTLCDAARGGGIWYRLGRDEEEPLPPGMACHAGYGTARQLLGGAAEATREALAQIRAARRPDAAVTQVLACLSGGDSATPADLWQVELICSTAWPEACFGFLPGAADHGVRRGVSVTLIVTGAA